MKIAYDHQTFTNQSYGGISRYYTILANELLDMGQDVKVYGGIHRNNYLVDLPEGVVSGLKINKYPPKTGKFFKWMNHGYSQTKMKFWKPDLIHETYYSSLPRLNSNAVRVTSVYDMIHEIFNNQFSSRDPTTAWKKASIDRVDHIVSISHSTKNDLVEFFGIDESKISVVHLGVDLESFYQPKICEQFKDQQYILYVGARRGYKNFDGFLKACSSSSLIKNKIKVIAFGGGQFSAAEIQLIKQLGFKEGNIEHISGSDEILTSLYGHAMCFVYPSLYEGFGLPPLEAMAAGCPVVSSNTSSMPEVVNDAGIYFKPNDIDEIRNSIETVIMDSALKVKLIHLGYENIKRFTWKKCAEETNNIYKDLIG